MDSFGLSFEEGSEWQNLINLRNNVFWILLLALPVQADVIFHPLKDYQQRSKRLTLLPEINYRQGPGTRCSGPLSGANR